MKRSKSKAAKLQGIPLHQRQVVQEVDNDESLMKTLNDNDEYFSDENFYQDGDQTHMSSIDKVKQSNNHTKDDNQNQTQRYSH